MTIYESMMAKAAEWRKYDAALEERDLEEPGHYTDCANQLEALAKQVCAEAIERARKNMFKSKRLAKYAVTLYVLECDIIGGPQTENPPQPSGQGG